MLGYQEVNTELFQCVTMEDLVPANHMLRRLKSCLDLSFVTETVKDCYGKVGRPSFDPQVVARIWILQHLYGFSERQICDEISMHAGYRWFCGLSFNDRVPDQSTLVKLRTSKWAETGIWGRLLSETVRACEAAGICRPDRMGVDGTQINANAATVSLEEITPSLTVSDNESVAPHADEPVECNRDLRIMCATPSRDVPLEPIPNDATDDSPGDTPPAPPKLTLEAGDRAKDKRRSGDPDWHGERFSNATHRSTTDPEARLYRKGSNQEAKLRYLGHYMADLKSGVIYGAMATQANGTAEREAACALLDQLPVKPRELVADLGYRDSEFLGDVIQRGVQPVVPIGGEPHEPEPKWRRRTYNIERHLKRKQHEREIRARNLTRTASAGRRGAIAQRQRTRLEHLYAEAKEHHGLARAQGRGLVRVDQQVKLTAMVQNLKRLLTARRRRGTTAQSTDICSPALLHVPISSHTRVSRPIFTQFRRRRRNRKNTFAQ